MGIDNGGKTGPEHYVGAIGGLSGDSLGYLDKQVGEGIRAIGDNIEEKSAGAIANNTPGTQKVEKATVDEFVEIVSGDMPDNWLESTKAMIPDDSAMVSTVSFSQEGGFDLSKDITKLLTPPTRVEELLIQNEILYVGGDGKLYFTPDAIKYYVSNAMVLVGAPEELLRPGVNAFGFLCIDGRIKLPEGFDELPLEEQIKMYPGAIPGGGAGMVMNIIASVRNLFGDNMDIIKKLIFAILEKNKQKNPDNYKIQWHTDKHTEDHKQIHSKETNTCELDCGCGFLMKAQANPEEFGLNKEMVEFVAELLHNPEWSANPEILGDTNPNLEHHKERAAFIIKNLDRDSINQNIILKKQVDFSSFIPPQDLENLSELERDELKQMAFTVNFRSFPVKASQLARTIEKVIIENDDLLESVQISEKQRSRLAKRYVYFNPKFDKKISGTAIYTLLNSHVDKNLKNMTTQIKGKLSPSSPVVEIDLHKNNTVDVNISILD